MTRTGMGRMGMKQMAVSATVMIGLSGASAASAQEKLKIGELLTLSGPSAVLGVHQRDGFALAVKQLGGKLGGLETEVIVVDDELKPDVAVQKVQGLIERDKVQMIAGVTFSNVMMAIAKPAFESETFIVGSNAGPSPLAGKACSPFFATASYQNDQAHEGAGKYAQARGYKKMLLIAPNYQAGKDSIAGFKRYYKGEIVEEIYTQLGQLDFSAELAKVSATKPDAIFVFMPGGMGVNLVKQYNQAGLAANVPMVSTFTVDESTLPGTQDAALGVMSVSQWAPDLDNAANKAFVPAFEKEYGYAPSFFAQQGYDAALLIDAAVKSVGGNLKDKAALQKAFRAARFNSTRGAFKLNPNGFPTQDFYAVKAVKRADGKYVTSLVEKVFENHSDVYGKDCPLN
jgi:branched-chain amino acid transport system substrate-binding protein